MDIQITYAEIAEYCVKKIKLSPSFTCHDERTLEIYYRPISFLPPISFKIRIEAVQNETVFLSYDCGNATSMVFNGVIIYLENTIPQGIDVNTENKQINLHLLRMKQLQNFLQYVELKDILFDETVVHLQLIVK